MVGDSLVSDEPARVRPTVERSESWFEIPREVLSRWWQRVHPNRLVGVSAKTVHRVLTRHGLARLPRPRLAPAALFLLAAIARA